MLKPRQEKFIALYAAGRTAAAAYSAAYGRAGHSAEASGARLLRNAEVQARLAELRAKASHEAVMTLDDVVRRLLEMFETPISALDENHPYTRRMTVSETGQAGKVVRSVRIVEKDSPLAILCEIARLLGLYGPKAKPGRAKGQPEAGEATVADLIASLKIKAKGGTAKTA